jgi:hypothetical protein
MLQRLSVFTNIGTYTRVSMSPVTLHVPLAKCKNYNPVSWWHVTRVTARES